MKDGRSLLHARARASMSPHDHADHRQPTMKVHSTPENGPEETSYPRKSLANGQKRRRFTDSENWFAAEELNDTRASFSGRRRRRRRRFSHRQASRLFF